MNTVISLGFFSGSVWQIIGETSAFGLFVLICLTFMSMVSWIIIFNKWRNFRAVEQASSRFQHSFERSAKLADSIGQAKAHSLSPLSSIFMTGYKTINAAIDELKSPGYDYILKPVLIDQLLLIIKRAQRELNLMERNRLLMEENAQLRDAAPAAQIEDADGGEVVKSVQTEEKIEPLKIATITSPKDRAIATYERQQQTIRTRGVAKKPEDKIAEQPPPKDQTNEAEIVPGDEE